MKKMIATFPPLSSPFGTYRADKEVYTLLTQRIGAVETGQPLLYFSNAGNIRKAVLAGEGIWRWRLNEYAQKESTVNMDELFGKIIQYLIVKESKVPFRVRYKNHSTKMSKRCLMLNCSTLPENSPMSLK